MKLRIKYLIENILKIFLKILNIFPLQNRVVLSSFSGRQYSDSPRRISEQLRREHPEIPQIWAFRNPGAYRFLKEQGIKTVRFKSLGFIYYSLTSKVYVDNTEFWSLFQFRKGQTVLETFHGGGAYKKLGADRPDVGELEHRHVVKKMSGVTLFLSSSEAFTKYVIRGAYQYHGEVMSVGLPRNDELLSPDEKKVQKIKETLGIGNKKVLLYAPTFRNSHSTKLYSVDFDMLRLALEKRFGGEWVILLRLHYYMAGKEKFAVKGNDIVDASLYPDMQELLSVTDVLLTDYSSSVWDFSLTGRPCFLYSSDLEDYAQERNFYVPITSWPYPLARTNEELKYLIENFDEKKYVRDVLRHHSDLGNRETGRATTLTCDRIVKILEG